MKQMYFTVFVGLFFLTNGCKKEDEPIIKKYPVIVWENPADITFGTLLDERQMNATTDVPGSFVYNPGIGTRLNIGDSQELVVDFTPDDTVYYNTASKKVTINVKPLSTVTDQDGNVYHTVMIGTQLWMLENLKTTKYRNGDNIPNITDNTEWFNYRSGAYCDYNNDRANSDKYGRLYNWFAVNDSRKITPKGWHVATANDWETLISHLRETYMPDAMLVMALAAQTDWKSSTYKYTIGYDLSKNNGSGFTALPGGYRGYEGYFTNIGMWTGWWSSTESSESSAYYWKLINSLQNVLDEKYTKDGGYSVRCVLD